MANCPLNRTPLGPNLLAKYPRVRPSQLSRLGSTLSILDFVNMGSALSIRSMARMGSSLSIYGLMRMGSSIRVLH